MAGTLEVNLKFHPAMGVEGNKDCGTRTAVLPLPLPPLGDDFVWEARDFDGFRMAMLEEMAARFPERAQWTPADLEVVLLEVLSWGLDQLSDMLDRVTAEAYLETARRPESVRRLLSLIGYEVSNQEYREWTQNPMLMEAARRAGPKSVRRQHRRMVSVDDYAQRMEMHPLVRRAVSSTLWNGSWSCILVTVILWGWERLERRIPSESEAEVFVGNESEYVSERFHQLLKDFHAQQGLPKITEGTRVIDSLRAWSDSRRMVGQEVLFEEATRIGVDIELHVQIASQCYQSEVLQAVRTLFNAQEGGFFEIGRLSFGTHLNKSDVIQTVMQLEGIENVQVKTFRRSGSGSTTSAERIVLEGVEVAVCDSNPDAPEHGVLLIQCSGGLKG